MSALFTDKFGEYELRPATPADYDQAREWTAADPIHQGVIDPAFWLEQGVATDSYVLKDAQGDLFFIRLERVTRIRMQFAPTVDNDQKTRLRMGLITGIRWLTGALGRCSVGEIIFDSADKLLRRFAIGSLMFSPATDTLKRPIRIVQIGTQAAPVLPAAMESSVEADGKSLRAT